MHLNSYQKYLIAYLGALVVYWLYIQYIGTTESFHNYFFSFSFTLIPLIGGFLGILFSRAWGGLKSAVGRGVFYISSGSLAWGLGNVIWSYYNFFVGISAPYPSLADIGFVVAIPLWLVGVINLSRATGAWVALKEKRGKWLLGLTPFVVGVVSYYLLVTIARGGVLFDTSDALLKLLLDLAYPLGDVLIATIILVIFGLSARYLGGRYQASLLTIFVGFVAMYFADFIFSYTTTIGTFYVGNWGDLIFTLALFTIVLGTFGFQIKDTNP